MEEEQCCICDSPTGKAGRGDDSIYVEIGPLCDKCTDIPTRRSRPPTRAYRSRASGTGTDAGRHRSRPNGGSTFDAAIVAR